MNHILFVWVGAAALALSVLPWTARGQAEASPAGVTVRLDDHGAMHADTHGPSDAAGVHGHGPHEGLPADMYGPIGVMGDHMMHEAGEWMVSYRYMRMRMNGNRDGTDHISRSEIATSVRNPFFGLPGQPPTLRVVPTDMDMQMHMLGLMYAPTEWLTLMAMLNYVGKKMDHITYQGPTGTTQLGTFQTKTDGLGDTRVTGLLRLYEDAVHHVHLNAGISLPTGDIRENDQVLTPTGASPTVRLPYAMQLGSGTYDLLPGLTYTGRSGRFSWGAQYAGVFRLGDNDEHYSLGNEQQLTAWGAYLWNDALSTSLRVTGQTVDEIDGQDPLVVAPVQTADPNNYGGNRIQLSLGANLAGQHGALRGHWAGIELGIPVYQDLNGPQLETDWTLMAGYRYSF